MANIKNLDAQFRLTPWNDKVHAEIVASNYGSMLAVAPHKAEAYVKKYEEKEVEALENYKAQQEHIKNSGVALGYPPQTLPDLVPIEWDPRKRFKTTKPKEKEEAPKAEAPKAEEVQQDETPKAADPAPKTEAPKAEQPKKGKKVASPK